MTPVSSGLRKLADAKPRLMRLKLRARSDGFAMAPASVCDAIWNAMNDTPSSAAVKYSTVSDGQIAGSSNATQMRWCRTPWES